jgi:putative nucleotidyltransferase with HDIG domain
VHEQSGKDAKGNVIWSQIIATPLKDKNGNITAALEVVVPITERKQASEDLKHSCEKLQKTLESAVEAMASIAEIRDPYTAGHQIRVTALACAIAAEMGLSAETIADIRMGGMLHDIGKMYVPSEILSKPGKLSEIEFMMIKNHPQIGYDIVKKIEFPPLVAAMVLNHHERLDGSGYPHGLKGDDIVLEAKILAVADVVEAMSSHRPYRPALGIDKALEEIARNKSKLYDPDVVDACLKLFAEKGFKFE